METMALMGMNVAQLVVDEFNEVMVQEGQVEGVQKVIIEEEIVPDEL